MVPSALSMRRKLSFLFLNHVAMFSESSGNKSCLFEMTAKDTEPLYSLQIQAKTTFLEGENLSQTATELHELETDGLRSCTAFLGCEDDIFRDTWVSLGPESITHLSVKSSLVVFSVDKPLSEAAPGHFMLLPLYGPLTCSSHTKIVFHTLSWLIFPNRYFSSSDLVWWVSKAHLCWKRQLSPFLQAFTTKSLQIWSRGHLESLVHLPLL